MRGKRINQLCLGSHPYGGNFMSEQRLGKVKKEHIRLRGLYSGRKELDSINI